MRCLPLIVALLFCSTIARAQLFEFECIDTNPKGSGTVHLIQVDAQGKQVTYSVRMSSPITKGPFGPFPASVGIEIINWTETITRDHGSSTTAFTLTRKDRTLRIHVESVPFRDEDAVDEISRCDDAPRR